MSDVQFWIDRCRTRLNRGLVLKVTAEWLAVWLCAFGTLLLVTKVAWPALWPRMLWLGLSLVPVVAFAVRRAQRDGYTPIDGAALLDRRLKAAGLLMAVAEKPNEVWRRQLPREEAVWTAALPRLRPVRFARVVVLPLAFALVALLLPARPVPTSAAAPQRQLPAVQELPEMLAELKQADVLDPTEAAFLQEEIDKLTASTSKAPPTPDTWRKIDALRARLNDRLDRETRTIEKGTQAARKLARAGKNGVPPLSNEQRRQLEQDLADALKRTRQAKAAAASKKQAPDATASKTGGKTTSPTQKPEKSPQAPVPSKSVGKTAATGPAKKSPATAAKTGKSPAAGKTPANGVETKSPSGTIPAGKQQPAGVAKAKDPVAKTPPMAKSPIGTSPKQAGKSGQKQKEPSGKKPPAFDPSTLRDLAKIAKMVENLSPEMQEKLKQEAIRMIQSGQLRIPDDPAVREMLMKQARQMLEQDGRRLEELRKRFGHLAGNLEQWKKLQPPEMQSSLPSNTQTPAGKTSDGGKGPNGVAGKQPAAGPNKQSAGSVSFRDVVLPPGLLDKPRTDPDSVSGKRPVVAPFQPTAPSGSKTAADPAGEKWRALRRKVRPRNRNLVYQYFYEKNGK